MLQDRHTEPHYYTSALLVIDMQNGFVSPKAEKEGTKYNAIVDGIISLLHAYRSKGKPIVHVIRAYLPDGSDADVYRKGIIERGEFSLAPGSVEADIFEPLKPPGAPAIDFDKIRYGKMQELGPEEHVMYKPRLGAFHKTPLETWLRKQGLDTVVVAGTFFPNCVRQTITEANERDFRTVCATDAVVGIHDTGGKELGAMGVSCIVSGDIIRQL